MSRKPLYPHITKGFSELRDYTVVRVIELTANVKARSQEEAVEVFSEVDAKTRVLREKVFLALPSPE